jgi:hypothetical protein
MVKNVARNGDGSRDGNGVLGHPFPVWRMLQDGQEKVIRWSMYRERFPGRLREQNGHEHRASIGFLSACYLVCMRPYVCLDELLLTWSVEVHDVSEGILRIDIPSTRKRAENDLSEYVAFRKYYEPLGKAVWSEMRRAFLLQFALDNPPCFPREARTIMRELAKTKRREALFFDGLQRLDYLFYAYECHVERGVTGVLTEVTRNQYSKLNAVADELPGFGSVVWTPSMRKFFGRFNE